MQSMKRIALLAAALVRADLPIHCERSDFTGLAGAAFAEGASGSATWKLTMTPAVPLGEALHTRSGHKIVPENFHSNEKYCGLGAPNTNMENVAFMQNGGMESLIQDVDDTQTFKYKLSQERRILDHDAPHRQAYTLDCVDDLCRKLHQPAEGLFHTWTPTYDEGLELKMMHGDQRVGYMMLAEYRCDAGNSECGKIGAGEKDDGETTGYSSICGRSLVGWYNRPLEDGRMGRGCFFAQKEDEASATQRHSVTMVDRGVSLLETHTVYRKTDFDNAEHVKAFSSNLNFVADSYSDFLQHHKDADRSEMLAQKRSGTVRFHSKTNLNVHDACDASNEIYADLLEKMPKTFNWASHFDGKWRLPVVDQGACGSCYGVAMLSSLQSRANLHFFNALEQGGVPQEKWPRTPPVSLSVQAHLSCNMFDQACQGGYPYTSAKWVSLNGVPTESCAPSVNSTHGEVNQCPTSCFKDDTKVMYSRDNYGYNSGAYGSGCGEVGIMKSIVEQGPIMAAIEVTPDFSRAAGHHIVGESFLQGGRDHEFHNIPKSHNQHRTTMGANVIEAKFAIKHPDDFSLAESAETHGCPANAQKLDQAKLRQELDDLARSMDRDGTVFSVKDDSTFFIDTSKVPDDVQGENTNMWKLSRETVAKAFSTSEKCVHLEMAPLVDDGWEHTNHAIIMTGFGEALVHDHVSFAETGDHTAQKKLTYWIVQNSWGSGYGEGGFSYVARSKNYGGLEHQGVDIQARFDVGMMASLLEPYQQYVPEGKELKYRAFPHAVTVKDDPVSNSLLDTGLVAETQPQPEEVFTIPELPANLSGVLTEAFNGRKHHRHHELTADWGRAEMKELEALRDSFEGPRQVAFVEMGPVPDARDLDITPPSRDEHPMNNDALLDLELGVPDEARSDILDEGVRDDGADAVPLLQKNFRGAVLA